VRWTRRDNVAAGSVQTPLISTAAEKGRWRFSVRGLQIIRMVHHWERTELRRGVDPVSLAENGFCRNQSCVLHVPFAQRRQTPNHFGVTESVLNPHVGPFVSLPQTTRLRRGKMECTAPPTVVSQRDEDSDNDTEDDVHHKGQAIPLCSCLWQRNGRRWTRSGP